MELGDKHYALVVWSEVGGSAIGFASRCCIAVSGAGRNDWLPSPLSAAPHGIGLSLEHARHFRCLG